MATGNELDRRSGDNTATQATELVAPPELGEESVARAEQRSFHRTVVGQAFR